MLDCSREHEVLLPRDIGHGSMANFDDVWCEALSACDAGEVTHLLQTHADVFSREPYFADVMMRVMEACQVPLVSVPIAIKDNRALLSCGLANPANPFYASRMLAIDDLDALPPDFDQSDLGEPGHILLHNHGCWLIDLRDLRWRTVDENGDLAMCFQIVRRNRKGEDGRWRAEANSEDWYISRVIHGLGIPSVITQRVKLWHRGVLDFPNWNYRREWEQEQARKAAAV